MYINVPSVSSISTIHLRFISPTSTVELLIKVSQYRTGLNERNRGSRSIILRLAGSRSILRTRRCLYSNANVINNLPSCLRIYMKIVEALFQVSVYRFQIADPVSNHAVANAFMTTFDEHSLLTFRRAHRRCF